MPPARLDAARRQVKRAGLAAVSRLRGLICGLLCVLWPPAAAVQELIANQDSAHRQVTQNEARLYFTLRLQRWPDGQPVRTFVLPDEDPLHVAFTKNLLGLFPYQLRSTWDRQVFSGTGQAPTRVTDESEMIQQVATTPGAVGYARSAPRDPRVRTLEVR